MITFLSKVKDDEQGCLYKKDLESTSDYYSNVFNSIEDGVSVLDKDYVIEDVNFTVKKWYKEREKIIGLKCYEVFHNRTTPCEICPVRRTLETGKMHVEVIPFKTIDTGEAGWKEIKGYPIYGGEEVVGVVEYVKDVTYEMDLFSKVAGIERELANLKAQNEILKTFIDQKEKEQYSLQNNISLNINNLIKPVIKEINSSMVSGSIDRQMILFLESLIDRIVEPYLTNVPDPENNFTTREVEILQLIKQGKSSKEIATLLFVTPKTVAFHRGNIRKKLGLCKTDNLRTHILKNPNFSE